MTDPRDFYTYEDFVERACEGQEPTEAQAAFIRDFLRLLNADPMEHEEGLTHFRPAIFLAGRGGGKTTLRRWIIKFLCSIEAIESNQYNGWWLSEMEGGVKQRG